MRAISEITAILPVLLLLASAAQARSRPDQVLVLYNADWTEDLDGSEPGQDSMEIAEYYVRRRTDPKTGRRPWLLGLSAGRGSRSPLNGFTLPERSRDNELGLILADGTALQDRPPLSSIHGNAGVPVSLIQAGRAPPRFAGMFVHDRDLSSGTLEISLVARGADSRELTLGTWGPAVKKRHPALALVRLTDGLLMAVDLLALAPGRWDLELRAQTTWEKRIFGSGTFSRPPPGSLPSDYREVRWGSGPVGFRPPPKTGALPDLLSLVDILSFAPEGRLFGLLLTKPETEGLDPESLRLTLRGTEGQGEPLLVFSQAERNLWPTAAIWRLTDGRFFLSINLAECLRGTVEATFTGFPRGKWNEWRKVLRLNDPAEVGISQTGPDGLRDDATYLELVEKPIREFLDSHQTDDGIPLRGHILHVVIAHGLPIQVRSTFGIERGVLNSPPGDLGAQSALGQRLMLLDFDAASLFRTPELLLIGDRADEVALPVLAHPLRRCLFGPDHHPLLHPHAHRKQLAEEGFEKLGFASVRQAARPPLTSELRSGLPEGRRLFGVGRLDGSSVEIARRQVDGAIYAERYLTPGLGSAGFGPGWQARLSAKAAAARGFRCLEVGESKGGPPDEAVIWVDVSESVPVPKLLPGGIAGKVGRNHGFDPRRAALTPASLFERFLRAGAAVSAGSAGGAPDASETWPDPFVLMQLLFDGYEYGDAALRSSTYLDWTISLVGDPLYRPALGETTEDRTPPCIADRSAVHLDVEPAGPSAYAVHARIDLANEDPEMVAATIICRPVGHPGEPVVRGVDPAWTRNPSVWAMPLAADRRYDVEIIVRDPYGNETSTRQTLGPLLVETGPPSAQEVLKHTEFKGWLGKDVLRLGSDVLDRGAELEIRFLAGAEPRLPVIVGRGDVPLLDRESAFAAGGAGMKADAARRAMEPGGEYTLLLRWRRSPLTREVYLVARDGTLHLVAAECETPWNPAHRLGNRLEIRSGAPPRELTLRDNPVATSSAQRGGSRPEFDPQAFMRANRIPPR